VAFIYHISSFVSFLTSCPSSLRVLPRVVSIDEAGHVLVYLLSSFLSFVGTVHRASPPLPSCLILSVIMKSDILPLLRFTNGTYHISLYGMLVRDLPPLCPAHSSWTSEICPPSSFVSSLWNGRPKLFPNTTRSTISVDVECVLFFCRE